MIDITTRGRNTGQPHRIERRFHQIAGQVSITGRPPHRRAWYANLLAHPACTVTLTEGLHADLPARATPILDEAQRRAIIAAMHQQRGGSHDGEAWVAHRPLVAVACLVPCVGGWCGCAERTATLPPRQLLVSRRRAPSSGEPCEACGRESRMKGWLGVVTLLVLWVASAPAVEV